MDYLPITYQRPDSGAPHQPTPMRELLKSLLHEELVNPHLDNQGPLKWTQSFQLHHHYHPGEVKVFIKDGVLRVHAKHVRGEDDENCDIRESKRYVTLPRDIERNKLHCYSHGHQLVVEAPFAIKIEKENGVEVEIKETDEEETSDDDNSSSFKHEIDLSVFKPDHISVRRFDHDVVIRAEHSQDEDGIKVSRSFHREFKIPSNAVSGEIRCQRNKSGLLIFRAPLAADDS